jgi:hypothetical protein
MNNPETPTTLGSRYRTKTNKLKKTQTRKLKRYTTRIPIKKKPGVTRIKKGIKTHNFRIKSGMC